MSITGKVFGRRVPEGGIYEEPVRQPDYDAIKEAPKKKDLGKEVYSIESDTFFKERNLFIPELLLIVISAFGAIIALFIARVSMISGVEGLKGSFSSDAYNQLVNLVGTMNSIYLLAVLAPVLVMVAFFCYKFVSYYPRKNKVIVARVWKTGLIRFSVERIKDGILFFEKGPTGEKIKVTNPKYHWDNATGRPVIVLKEGDGENQNLNTGQDVSERGREWSNVSESIWGTACRLTEYNLKKKDSLLSNPLFIIMIIVLVAIAGLAYIVIRQPDMIKSMLQPAAPVALMHLGF